MIIIEGPDNAGKTTLAQSLSNSLNIPLLHSGGPPKDVRDIEGRNSQIITSIREPFVRDRVPFISDLVYGKALGRGSVFEKEGVFNFHLRQVLMIHPVIILCWPPFETLMDFKNHKVKEHETEEHVDAVKANQQKVIQYYDQLFQDIPHYKYDYTQEVLQNRFSTILFACMERLKIHG